MQSVSRGKAVTPAPINDKWDGFADPFWNVGQAVLWIATCSKEFVDKASNKSGKYQGSYGLAAAALIFDEHVSEDDRDNALDKLTTKLQEGRLKAFCGGCETEKTYWIAMEFVFDHQNMIATQRRGSHSLNHPCENIYFCREDLLREFPQWEDAHHACVRTNRKRRGAPPKYDWGEIEMFVFKQMKEKGEFQEWDSEWKTQAELERAVLNYMMMKWNQYPGESTTRARVSAMLEKWRDQQGEGQ